MDLRLDLIRHYRWLRQYGLIDSHNGNISIRSEQDYWIAPALACAETLQADELIRCRLGDEPASGASADAKLHETVYAAIPSVNAIICSHGSYSLAITLSGHDFVPPDSTGQAYFPKVPVLNIPCETPANVSPQLVAAALQDTPVVVVRGHAVYCCAENLNLAYKWTCSLESSAKLAYLQYQLGQA